MQSTRDEMEVRALIDTMYAAWARNDAAAYAACFEGDSDYVAFDGSLTRGREGNERLHAALFASVLFGTRIVGKVDGVRFLSSDVALVHTSGGVVWPWHHTVPKARRSIQTLVVVRRSGVWRAAAFHNTRVRPVSAPGGLLAALFRRWIRLRSWMAGVAVTSRAEIARSL